MSSTKPAVVPPFRNVYHKRQVAAAAARACYICCKPTPVVLVSSDGKADFFYICDIHLQDAGFAVPLADPEVDAARKKLATLEPEVAALARSVELKKKEAAPGYIAAFFQKKPKDDKKKDADKDKDKDAESSVNSWDREQGLLDKLNETKDALQKTVDTPPRVFNLDKTYYVMRLNAHRSVLASKQVGKMLSDPANFPKVPKHIPGSEAKPAAPSDPPSGGDTDSSAP